jgi:hypothetical protein
MHLYPNLVECSARKRLSTFQQTLVEAGTSSVKHPRERRLSMFFSRLSCLTIQTTEPSVSVITNTNSPCARRASFNKQPTPKPSSRAAPCSSGARKRARVLSASAMIKADTENHPTNAALAELGVRDHAACLSLTPALASAPVSSRGRQLFATSAKPTLRTSSAHTSVDVDEVHGAAIADKRKGKTVTDITPASRGPRAVRRSSSTAPVAEERRAAKKRRVRAQKDSASDASVHERNTGGTSNLADMTLDDFQLMDMSELAKLPWAPATSGGEFSMYVPLGVQSLITSSCLHIRLPSDHFHYLCFL